MRPDARSLGANPVGGSRFDFHFVIRIPRTDGSPVRGVRLATWDEMDLKTAVRTVPTERMNPRKEHKVPLPGRTVEILGKVQNLVGEDSGLVFPAGRPLSDMVYMASLRRLEISAVAHGSRSSFKDRCTDMYDGDDRWLLSETALAHNLGNSTEAAYARSDLLELRRPLIEAWAEFCRVARGMTRTTLRNYLKTNMFCCH